MTLSRWKLMAVGLGVSLGGLAAMAGQCPKDEPGKARPAETPPVLDVPVLPAVKAALELPPLPAPGDAAPVVPPASVPDTPPPLPVPATEPVKKPEPAAKPTAPKDEAELPKLPDTTPMPLTPPVAEKPAPMKPVEPTRPTPVPAEMPVVTLPASAPVAAPTTPATLPPAAAEVVPAGRTAPAAPVAAALNAAKFRILLRVGEGEPSFEVKCGDDLVLKVVCEKVDIASPEKGSGPSTVKASGKVRFAGFGAEGVCEELSFLAGTGEVRMAGDVNIKVKDKLGRVESEFTTASVKYKLDPAATVSPR